MLSERHKTFHVLHQTGCFVIPNPGISALPA